MKNRRKSMWDGAVTVSPILLGVVPFGVIFGAVAVEHGFSVFRASAMSVVVFAGAAQLAVVHLMGEHASLAVMLCTGLVINMRMLMYSASLAPHFSGVSKAGKPTLAYFLTDQAFAVSIARFTVDEADHGRSTVFKAWYYLGAALVMWSGWQAATVFGAVLGKLLPPDLGLDFAVPLTFLALTIPVVRDRECFGAALAAGAVALLAAGLPYNLGLMAAAVAGIATGCVLEARRGE